MPEINDITLKAWRIIEEQNELAKTAYELLNDDISKEVAASRILKVVRDKGEDLPGMLDDSNLSFD